MAATIDSANVIANTANNGTTLTCASVICSGPDNLLLVAVGLNQSSTGGPPSGVTYNSVAMVAAGNQNDTHGGGGLFNASWWYMLNPPLTTASAIATWGINTSGAGMIAIPMAGTNTAIVPVCGVGNDQISTAASCAVSGAGSNDLQLGMVIARSTTCVSAGAPQAVVTSTPTMPRTSINGLNSFSADFVTAGSPGNFAWTLTSGIWVALGITVSGSIFAPIPQGAKQTFVNEQIFQY